jgi:hypothetical protein
MIEIVIVIPEPATHALVARRLSAKIQPAGYSVEVWCMGWGKNPDGSIRLDLVATVTCPAPSRGAS